MTAECPKYGGAMEERRIANKVLFGFRADRQKHWSFDASVERARACLACGDIEMYVDPQEVKRKLANTGPGGASHAVETVRND